jgi:hypothetical protein
MFILCIAEDEQARTQGLALAAENDWKVLLVGGEPGVGGLPGFLVEANVPDDARGRALMMFSTMGLNAEPLTEER